VDGGIVETAREVGSLDSGAGELGDLKEKNGGTRGIAELWDRASSEVGSSEC